MIKTIDEFICPKCDNDDCYPYDTDEIDFSSDGTGHYYVYCYCKNCDRNFKQCYEFKYEITKEWSKY